MALLLLFLLFPFYWMVITSVRPDGELYRPWNSINYNPFWTWKPTWDHVRYLFEETLFASWLWNTTFIALASTAISLVCGVFAGYALSRLNFPFAGSLGTAILPATSGPVMAGQTGMGRKTLQPKPKMNVNGARRVLSGARRLLKQPEKDEI